MKKQYINPTTSIFKMQMRSQILTVSGGVTTNSSGEVQSVGTASGSYGGGDILSRRGGSLWDDEDEE